MRYLFAGQKVTEERKDDAPVTLSDGNNYRIVRVDAWDGKGPDVYYYTPLYVPNGDITHDANYYLGKTTERFCKYMAFFTHDANFAKLIISLPRDEVYARLNRLEYDMVGMDESNDEFNDLRITRFCLIISKLRHLSQERININAEYCDILEAGASAHHRLPELHARWKSAFRESGRLYQSLFNEKEERYLHMQDGCPIDREDVNWVLSETISEMCKLPPVMLDNPTHKIPNLKSFIINVCNVMESFIYQNKAGKTAAVCEHIEALMPAMLNAAGKIQPSIDPDVSNDLMQSVGNFAQAAKYKSVVSERDPEFFYAKANFDQAYNALNMMMAEAKPGFILEATARERKTIADGMEVIEKMTEAKHSLRDSVKNCIRGIFKNAADKVPVPG